MPESTFSAAPSPATVECRPHQDIRHRQNLDRISEGFEDIASCSIHLIETLRSQLERSDAPNWEARLVDSLIEASLTLGTAGVASVVASIVVNRDDEMKLEFVKKLFEKGLKGGVEIARQVAHRNDGDAVDSFINAQQRGVESIKIVNRDYLRTIEEDLSPNGAASLAAAVTGSIDRAATKQYEASRDTWVAGLAQATFGVVPKGRERDSDTTNMTSSAYREKVNAGGVNFLPPRGPEFGSAVLGQAPGVLCLAAKLPTIEGGIMNGAPSVAMAFLNGVNRTIRNQYRAKTVGEVNIPRQIVCRVDGDLPDFVVDIDESGRWLPVKHSQWLRARASVGHPERASLDEFAKTELGLAALLQELLLGTIEGGM